MIKTVKNITIEKGNPGVNDGWEVDISMLDLPQDVKIHYNFMATLTVGRATCYEHNGVVKMDAEIEEDYLTCFPAIGYRDNKLLVVGACVNPNEDESIHSIQAQLNEAQR